MYILFNKANGEFVRCEDFDFTVKHLRLRIIVSDAAVSLIAQMKVGEYGYVGHFVIACINGGGIVFDKATNRERE